VRITNSGGYAPAGKVHSMADGAGSPPMESLSPDVLGVLCADTDTDTDTDCDALPPPGRPNIGLGPGLLPRPPLRPANPNQAGSAVYGHRCGGRTCSSNELPG
jgi:hypothetical protein